MSVSAISQDCTEQQKKNGDCNMIENFIYNDIILYCKGWYQSKDDDIIKDLGYLFSKIYLWTPKTEHEVARMMLRVLDKLYADENKVFDDESPFCFVSFFDEVERNMRLYNVSFDMAIIIYVKSRLFEVRASKLKLNPPHYGKKEHFRLGNPWGFKNPISMTYKEMNRIAAKAFSEE